MEKDFTPSVCSGENPTFKGKCKVRMPKYVERLKMLEQMNIDFNADDKVVEKNLKDTMPTLIMVAEVAEKHLVSCDLQKINGGDKYQSFSELEYDPDCAPIINEIGMFVIRGGSLGKN